MMMLLGVAIRFVSMTGVRSIGLRRNRIFLRFVEGYENQLQYRIVLKQIRGRLFNGRIFSDVAVRLGHLGERGMTL